MLANKALDREVPKERHFEYLAQAARNRTFPHWADALSLPVFLCLLVVKLDN